MYWIGNVDIHNNVDVRDIVGAKNFSPLPHPPSSQPHPPSSQPHPPRPYHKYHRLHNHVVKT